MRSGRSSTCLAGAVAATLGSLCTSWTWANSGTQLPLSQYQAGTEQVTLIRNGNFEDPGASNGGVYQDPPAWIRSGDMYVAAPLSPPANAAATGNYALQAHSGGNDPLMMIHEDTPQLEDGVDYVLSAYLWNRGRPDTPGSGDDWGDLLTVKVMDPNDVLKNHSATIERVAKDGGDASQGYFIYVEFNQNSLDSWSGVGVYVDPGVDADSEHNGVPPPLIVHQIDNVAITKKSDFRAPSLIPSGPPQWNVDANGNWSAAGSWSGGVPNSATAAALFGSKITAPRTATVDVPVTVKDLTFDNANSYTLAGSSTLTLASGRIDVKQGSHSITAPLAGKAAQLAIAAGAALNIADNDLIIDYTGSSPAADIRAKLAGGFAAGAWNGAGLNSSAAAGNALATTALGYAEASDLGVTSFNATPIDDTAVVVKYTYYGDSNLDGVVNGDDYSLIDFGVAFNQAGWLFGDYNYDDVINGDDYSLIDYGFAFQAAPLSAVPEPTLLTLAGLGILGNLRRQRRL